MWSIHLLHWCNSWYKPISTTSQTHNKYRIKHARICWLYHEPIHQLSALVVFGMPLAAILLHSVTDLTRKSIRRRTAFQGSRTCNRHLQKCRVSLLRSTRSVGQASGPWLDWNHRLTKRLQDFQQHFHSNQAKSQQNHISKYDKTDANIISLIKVCRTDLHTAHHESCRFNSEASPAARRLGNATMVGVQMLWGAG